MHFFFPPYGWLSTFFRVFFLTVISLTSRKSCWQHGIPWFLLFLFIHPNRPWLVTGFRGCILCPHRDDVSLCRSAITGSCLGVNKRMSFLSSSLHLQQCPVCLVYLIWMVFEMGGKWLYSCCFVEFCSQDLFETASNILGTKCLCDLLTS